MAAIADSATDRTLQTFNLMSRWFDESLFLEENTFRYHFDASVIMLESISVLYELANTGFKLRLSTATQTLPIYLSIDSVKNENQNVFELTLMTHKSKDETKVSAQCLRQTADQTRQ